MAAELSTIYRQIAEGKGKEYELLFSLHGLFFAVTEFDPVTDDPLHSTVDDILHGLAPLNIEDYGWQNDRLQHIVDFVSSAIRSLIEVLHEKNIREHRITRPERVREVDSRCMMWLAKKPGFTIKQKIASEQRMMGVYHSTSLDTAENRLFKAFMEKLDDLLSEKSNAARKCGKPLNNDAERFTATVHNWLKSEECGLIGRWNNTPPNNTLLNDKNYRKIWKANIWLQNLNEDIEKDLKRLDEIKQHADFWLATAKLNRSDNIRFRQKVVFPNYKKLSFSDECELGGFFHSDTWKTFKVSSEKECLALNEFAGDISEKNLSPEKQNVPHLVAAVDLNSVLPNFTLDDGTKGVFTKKLLHQSHCITRKGKPDWYPCSSARSKLIDSMQDEIKTFSIHSIFNSALHSEADEGENKPLIEKACYDFAKTIKDELRCQKCIYVTCDDVEDFSPSVNAFKHSMNTAFPKTEIMPRSIAALFAHLPEIQKKFSDGDEFTVCTTYDEYKIETKIKIVINDKLKQTKGIQFKRLKYTKTIENSGETISGLSEKLHHIISFHDTALLKDRFSADSYHFASKHTKKQQPSGGIEIFVPSDFDLSAGALEYERLQSITPDIPLWLDCLPKLAMIDSTGKEFVLVDPEKVQVRTLYKETTPIDIRWNFKFPAGKLFYEFPLLKGEQKEKSNYFAFIEDTSFPLEQETECRLSLTYTYGVPKPYHLEFIPVSRPAKFKSVEVKWENESHRDYVHDMPIPNFVREYTWEDMKAVSGRKSERGSVSNLIEEWLPREYNKILTSGIYRIKRQIGSKYNDSSVFFLDDERSPICYIKNNQYAQVGDYVWCYIDKVPKGYQAFDPHLVGSNYNSCSFGKSLRFPAITVWNNGRSINDEDCPEFFKTETLRVIEKLQSCFGKDVPLCVKREQMFFLSCMHKDMPEWFANFLPKLLDSIEYPNWIAYALGDCSTEWQKDLLAKTIALLDEDKNNTVYVIKIFAKALWRVNNFVFNLTAEDAGKILNAISENLPVLKFNVLIYDRDYDQLEKRKTFSACLECIVALCRLRETKNKTVADEKMLEILSPSRNSDVKQILENLEDRKRRPIQVPTFLSFDIDRPENDHTPELLYAAHGYLSGKIDNNAIKVLEADFGNSED